MPQLPSTCNNQCAYLQHTVPHGSGIRCLAQITIPRLALSLVLLFPTDVFQLRVQVADFRGKCRDMRAVLIDIRSRGPDDNVEVYFDMCVGGRGRRRGETNGMVARLVRSESKLAIVRPTRTNDVMP